jgi:hypothetical protein
MLKIYEKKEIAEKRVDKIRILKEKSHDNYENLLKLSIKDDSHLAYLYYVFNDGIVVANGVVSNSIAMDEKYRRRPVIFKLKNYSFINKF